MTLSWVRKYYNVPAFRGTLVEYSGDEIPWVGVILSAKGHYLKIKKLDKTSSNVYHPTWKLRYLDSQ